MEMHTIQIKIAVCESQEGIRGSVSIENAPEDLARLSPAAIVIVGKAVSETLIEKHIIGVLQRLIVQARKRSPQTDRADEHEDPLAGWLRRGASPN